MEKLIKDVEDLKKEMEKITLMASDIAEIKNVLVGNPLDKDDRGLLGYKKIINDLVRFKDRVIYILIGLSISAGFGINRAIELLTK